MKYRNRAAAVLLAAVILLAGCGGEMAEPAPTTVADIFVQSTAPNQEETVQVTQGQDDLLPVFSHGFTDAGEVVYEGGEMHVAFDFAGSGGGIENGVGYLLIVDGMPQPYKIEEDGEYRYMHILYPKFIGLKPTCFEFIFTPVTGQAGDVLEMYAVQVMDPGYRTSFDGLEAGRIVDTSLPVMKTIRMNATPEPMELPQIRDRVTAVQMEYVDVTASDVSGWRPEELRFRSETDWRVNGPNFFTTRWGTDFEEPVQIHFELWGNPDADFGLVFYVNHQPVTVSEAYIRVENESGKKLCIDMELDVSDLSGEAVLYYMIVYRNYGEVKGEGTHWFAETSSTIYLIEAERPEAGGHERHGLQNGNGPAVLPDGYGQLGGNVRKIRLGRLNEGGHHEME